MKVNNPNELVGKEVVDTNGNVLGTVDKTYNSWNNEYPGYFFGIRSNENTSDKYFRGTKKLIPIYNDYIKEVGDRITLNKTIEELGRFWSKTISCGMTRHPTDELIEKPVYDKGNSRVGTFCTWVESDGTHKNFGVLVDPYLCDAWRVPHNTLMPVPTNYIISIKDTVTIDKNLDELKNYWDKHEF